MNSQYLKVQALRDQAWAKARSHLPYISRIIENGVQDDTDRLVVEMVLRIVRADLTLKEINHE
jgi:hypothetical protein